MKHDASSKLKKSLFRKEVIEHNAANLAYGEPISIAPAKSRYLFWGVVAFAIASGVFLAVGRYPVTINVRGYITYRDGDSVPMAMAAVPARYVKRIKVGQEVVIHYDNFPYQKYGSYKAKIKSVGNTGLMSKKLNNDLPIRNQLVYPVYATLDDGRIKVGNTKIEAKEYMPFRAKIIIKKERIIWVILSSVRM